MLIMCLLMLISLTIAHNPIEKAMNVMETKYKVEATDQARKEICERIDSMQDVYTAQMRDIFVLGCTDDVYNRLKQACHGNLTKEKEIDKVFRDRDSQLWDNILADCEKDASDSQFEGNISDKIIFDLKTAFECDKVALDK